MSGNQSVNHRGYQQPEYQQPVLKVTSTGEYFLKEIGKWMNIIGVITSIMVAFMVLLAIYLISLGYSQTTSVGLIYLIVAAIYLFPIIKTFGVSKKFKEAVATKNSEALENGFDHLKSLATFFGVLAIIGVVILIISVIYSISLL